MTSRTAKRYRASVLCVLLLVACDNPPPLAPPVAQATPTPAPTPTPRFDSATACGAPVLGDEDARRARCEDVNRVVGGEYSAAVVDAMFWVNATRPDLFFAGTTRAKDAVDYAQAVVDRVARANGFCADRGEGDDLVRVKAGNGAGATGEWFDIVLADNSPWGPPPLMTRRCRLGSGW